MSFERILLGLLLLCAVAASTGIYERLFPPRPHFDDRGVLVLPRHQRSGERVELSLEDGGKVSVFVPRAIRRPRPIVALIEEQASAGGARCRALGAAWERSAFVVCVPIADGVEGSAPRLRSALQATKAVFGDYVARGSVILVGAGGAADQAVLLARQEPSFFRRLILIDGERRWSASVSAIFKQGGGERVLFVCESEPCRRAGRQLVTVTRSVGLDAALEPGRGWLERRTDWITAGDARFDLGR